MRNNVALNIDITYFKMAFLYSLRHFSRLIEKMLSAAVQSFSQQPEKSLSAVVQWYDSIDDDF